MAHLIELGRQSSTIKLYISAIKCILKQDKYAWDDGKACLVSLTKACKLQNDQFKTRLPITLGLLEVILFEINRVFSSQYYMCTLYKAMFALSYYSLFHVGELVLGPHQIKAKDIHLVDNKPKLLVVLHSSKTHGTYSRPQKVRITQEPTIKA